MVLTQKQMIEIKKTVEFGSTNQPWNDSTCHRPHRIGSMTKIFEGQKIETLSEFVHFYFRSGEERLELIKKNKGKETSFINYSYGRTKSELWVLAHTFHSYIEENTENPFNLTIKDCYIHMMIRIFLESFKAWRKKEKYWKNYKTP